MKWPNEIPQRNNFILFIPSTFLNTEDSLMLKTIKFGTLVRYCAIFKSDNMVIYLDDNDSKDYSLISQLSAYLLAPPYLRRFLFKHSDDLKFAGSLYPINLCSHNPIDSPAQSFIETYFDRQQNSEFVQKYSCGLAANKINLGKKYSGDYSALGLKKIKTNPKNQIRRGIIINNPKFDKKTIVFVNSGEVYEFKSGEGELFDYIEILDKETPVLLKYKPSSFSTFKFTLLECDLIKALNEHASDTIKIGTSIDGDLISGIEKSKIFSSQKKLSLIFGPYKDGIQGTISRIVKSNGSEKSGLKDKQFDRKKYFDYYLNTIPDQGTETVRIEEAIGITLAIFHTEIQNLDKK